MAQRHARGGLRRAARRYGVVGSRAILGALVGLACLLGAIGFMHQTHGNELLIERGTTSSDGVAASADATASGDMEANGDAASGGSAASEGDAGAQDTGGGVASAQPAATRFVVHVDGAVASPGVVELDGADLRVFDAVEEAGGLLDDADTSSVNLAEPLSDGAKIHIPHVGEQADGAAATSAGQAQTSGATEPGSGSVLVNINTATKEELQTLTGVGEATAAAIIDERERNGAFANPEDLMRVTGIGEKKFEKVRDQICV